MHVMVILIVVCFLRFGIFCISKALYDMLTNELMLALFWMITYLSDLRRGSKHRLRGLTRTSRLESRPVPEGILVKEPARHFHKKSGTMLKFRFSVCLCL